MWADAQRDGHPAEYRWLPLRKFRNSIHCTTQQSLADANAWVPCSNAANLGEHKSWTQSELCSLQHSVRDKSPPKCIYSIPVQEMAKHRANFGWLLLSQSDVGAGWLVGWSLTNLFSTNTAISETKRRCKPPTVAPPRFWPMPIVAKRSPISATAELLFSVADFVVSFWQSSN